jgi:hypothetical protein
MIDYEDFQPLYGFLKYKSKRKEHSYERNIGLKMVESENTRGGGILLSHYSIFLRYPCLNFNYVIIKKHFHNFVCILL